MHIKLNFFNRLFFVFILHFFLLFGLFAQHTNKKILVLHSYHIGYAWNDSISSGVVHALNKVDNVDVYVEHLDGKRHENAVYFKQLSLLFASKYKKEMFDLVISSDNLALEFMLLYGTKLFGNIPVVYCGVNNPYNYNLTNKPYYGILQTQLDGLFFRRLPFILPKMKNLYIISDSTETGLSDLARIKKLSKQLDKNVNYHYWNDIDVDSLFEKVKKVKPEDAIFIISLQRDKDGNPLNFGRITKQLCQISPVPVFCNNYPNIGKGVTGGCFVDAVEHGNQSAQLALNILFTPNFSAQKLLISVPKYYFDHVALDKYAISEDMLPEGSILINLPENIYAKYKQEIHITISIIIFLVVVILVLLKNIHRRKQAEKIIKEQYDEIQHQHQNILEINKHLNNTNTELEITNETLSTVNNELVLAKEHAEESDRLKTSFLQNMSHEIRTPMHAIMSFTNLLPNYCDDKVEFDNIVKLINQHCTDLLVVINDVLDIAKIESGQLSVNNTKCNINDLFTDLTFAFSQYQKRLDKQHIIFRMNVKCPINKAIIFTDRIKLNQILVNLVSNAFKFTETGSIEVECICKEDELLSFYVIDTGIGVSPEKQAAIFERFIQVENSNTRLYGGTGLGLSIVKGLVKLLGGQISLTSELGKGTTVAFFIPSKI